jgi:hypothetical protein
MILGQAFLPTGYHFENRLPAGVADSNVCRTVA